MKLYRYIPALDRENGTQLYKGMIENLQCARLRFTNPATLNDPLEAVAPYTFRENGNVVTPNTKEIKEILSTHLGKNVWEESRGKRILEVMPFGIPLEYAIMLCLSKVRTINLCGRIMPTITEAFAWNLISQITFIAR